MNLIYDEPFIKVRPQESDAVLPNPHKGIATYQRFQGDPLNAADDIMPNDNGPVEISAAPAQPLAADAPRSMVAYFRWFWQRFEPEKGKRRWDVVDTVLRMARERGQTVQLRLMPIGAAKHRQEPGVPAWYADCAQTVQTLYKDHREPVWHSSEYLRHWGDLISEFGARYDGHPDLNSVDVSVLGHWGEGGSENGGAAYPEQTQRLIDVYLSGFRKTPLISLINGYQFYYGISRGCGWRADCFGDLSVSSKWGQPCSPESPPDPNSWNHMYDYYPMQVVKARAQDAWKTKPVIMETCWVPQHWHNNRWDVDWIIRQGLKYHVSILMPKSSPIPSSWTDAFNDFVKRMGYRFVLRQIMTPAKVKPGGFFWYYLWIENIGVAPIYRNYRMAFRLTQGSVGEILLSPVNVTQWLPGDVWLDEKLPLPESFRKGPVRVEAALVDETSRQPRVQFAVRNVRDDGWHPLLDIEIV